MGVVQGRKSLLKSKLIIKQGASNTFKYRYGLEETVDGSPVTTYVDLSNWTAHSQSRKAVGGDVWTDLTEQNGISLASDGYITIVVTPEHTEAVVANATMWGVWDLELTSPDGEIVPFAEGPVEFVPDVTRSI